MGCFMAYEKRRGWRLRGSRRASEKRRRGRGREKTKNRAKTPHEPPYTTITVIYKLII